MSQDCESHGNIIDALPQPVLGMISGMVAAGVEPGDVIVYDSIRVPTRYLRDPIWAVYPEVKFLGAVPGTSPCRDVIAPSYGVDPSLTVGFNDPDGNISDRQLADVLYEATYVINMPIGQEPRHPRLQEPLWQHRQDLGKRQRRLAQLYL
jgi:hypothetical protein